MAKKRARERERDRKVCINCERGKVCQSERKERLKSLRENSEKVLER